MRFPTGARDFAALEGAQTGSGIHQGSCSVRTGGFSAGLMRSGSEADHSFPSNSKVKNEWTYTLHSPLHIHGLHNENFTFINGLAVQNSVVADASSFGRLSNIPDRVILLSNSSFTIVFKSDAGVSISYPTSNQKNACVLRCTLSSL